MRRLHILCFTVLCLGVIFWGASASALQPRQLEGRWIQPGDIGRWINITNVQGDWSWVDSNKGEALFKNDAGQEGGGNIQVAYPDMTCDYRIFLLQQNRIDINTRPGSSSDCLHGTFELLPP